MVNKKNIAGSRLKKHVICVFMLVAFVLSMAPSALAHKVSIFAWVEGDTVYIQSKFMGGKPPKNAAVRVFDTSGELLIEGKTDDKGEFSFQAPQKQDMQIVLDAGAGHRAVWSLSKKEFEDSSDQSLIETVSSKASNDVVRLSKETDVSATTLMSREEMVAIVNEALDIRLKPMMKMIAALGEDRISVSDVLGGIGYIIGLVGLAAYINYRRTKG